MAIQQKLVKNFDVGRFGYKPEAIVIHISQGTMSGAYTWFNNSTSKASSHYMVSKSGEIWQFVKDENTAWANGNINQPNWSLLKPNVNPNFYTLSIEFEGMSGEPWTQAMYNSAAELIKTLSLKWNISIDRNHIIGHNQIDSINRRSCPGSGVDLNKLIQLSIGFNEEDPEMIKELQNKINELTARVNSLQSELNITKSQLQSNKTQISELSKNNLDLQSKLNSQSGEVVKYKRDIEDLKDEIERMQNEDKNNLQRFSASDLFNAWLKKVRG